jgi:uncharacterized membrane protein YheB (UPF0754 family)
MNYWLFTIPFISALLGGILNWLATQLLFYPRKPKRIMGLSFQGLLPKSQPQLAVRLGKIVSDEFLSFSHLPDKINDPENLKKITPMIENHVDEFLRVKLRNEMPVLKMFIGDKTIATLKKVFMQEIEVLFPQVMKQFASNVTADLDIEQMVTKRITDFPTDKLETLVRQVLAKELRFVILTGAISGFIIGIVQILIIWLVES